MGEWRILSSRLEGGVWTLRAEGGDPAGLAVLHRGVALPGLAVSAQDDGAWQIRQSLPPEILDEGTELLLLTDGGRGLAHLPLILGHGGDEDPRAELAALRAELDLLKAVVRRLGRG